MTDVQQSVCVQDLPARKTGVLFTDCSPNPNCRHLRAVRIAGRRLAQTVPDMLPLK